MTKNELIYIDIGIASGQDYWEKIVVPSMGEFQSHPSTHAGLAAASALWHVHEWVWYDKNPNINSLRSTDYKAFSVNIIKECPELEWLKDLTNVGKHRLLTRKNLSDVSIVKQSGMAGRGGSGGYGVNAQIVYGSGRSQLRLYLRDGSAPWLEDVCARVFNYWKMPLFHKAPSGSL